MKTKISMKLALDLLELLAATEASLTPAALPPGFRDKIEQLKKEISEYQESPTQYFVEKGVNPPWEVT